MAAKKHSFDPECLTLAEYFYPRASKDRLYDLAQRIQDQVEAEDIEQPAPETKSNDPMSCPHCDGIAPCGVLEHARGCQSQNRPGTQATDLGGGVTE